MTNRWMMIAGWLIVLGWSTAAAQGTPEELAQKVEARYEQIEDLSADFTQSTTIEGFGTPLTSSGHLYIKKPGLLRWDYREPSRERIYVRGNDLKMYVPEHEQVVVGSLSQMVASKAPLRLLQGAADLDRHFALEPVDAPVRGAGKGPLLGLRPKDNETGAAPTLSRIVVELKPSTYVISRVWLFERSGNVSRFEFTEIRINEGLDREVFEFTPPEGTVIVEAPALSSQ